MYTDRDMHENMCRYVCRLPGRGTTHHVIPLLSMCVLMKQLRRALETQASSGSRGTW